MSDYYAGRHGFDSSAFIRHWTKLDLKVVVGEEWE
jgi:hypothetical protein